jgi:type II secretory pathway component GspD/PulD (secretin)
VKTAIVSLALGIVVVAVPPVTAQQKTVTPVESGARATGQPVALRVVLVVSRYQGEKKISSTPYTLSVVANESAATSMRMGVDVPVPQTVFKGGEGASAPQTSYTYRSVGTNIDCSARSIDDALFKLDLAVSDTSVFVPERQTSAPGTTLSGVPTFRSFTSKFSVLLRDGQTAQHTAATDPVSGEVLRIDVTLGVLK